MEIFDKDDPQTSFGAFKPVGSVVAVFENMASAMAAKADLLSDGYESMELTLMQGEAFSAMLDDMREDQGVLAVLGSELKKVDELRKHANRGACFLVVYAPSEEETDRVVKVVDRYNYRFALKYGHAFIERFDASEAA